MSEQAGFNEIAENAFKAGDYELSALAMRYSNVSLYGAMQSWMNEEVIKLLPWTGRVLTALSVEEAWKTTEAAPENMKVEVATQEFGGVAFGWAGGAVGALTNPFIEGVAPVVSTPLAIGIIEISICIVNKYIAWKLFKKCGRIKIYFNIIKIGIT